MFSKLKQIKDLRDQAKKMQSALASQTVSGSAGWGKVTIEMNGNQEVLNINIDPELLSTDKKEKLQNLLKEAFADAVKKVQKVMMSQMKQEGFSLPDLTNKS